MTILLRPFVYLALGPCVGLILFGVMVAGKIPVVDRLYTPVFLLGAYAFGIVPALISLVAVSTLQRRMPNLWRVLAWTPVIGVVSVILPLTVVLMVMRAMPRSWAEVGALVAVGALTCPICEFLALTTARSRYPAGRA